MSSSRWEEDAGMAGEAMADEHDEEIRQLRSDPDHYDKMADEEKRELADHIRESALRKHGMESAYQTLIRGLTDEQIDLLHQVERDIRREYEA